MSRLFGEMRQVGIVVRDVVAAMKHWVEVCGVGPWFYAEKLPVTSFGYGDQHFDGLHMSVALANSGDIQPELIQQRCDTPACTLIFWTRDIRACNIAPVDLSTTTTNCSARCPMVNSIGQQAGSPRGRFVYFWNEGHPGTVIEMAHNTPDRKLIFDAVREAVRG